VKRIDWDSNRVYSIYKSRGSPPHQEERNSKLRTIKSKEDTDKEVGSKNMSVSTRYGENKYKRWRRKSARL
jgi:hypothetical protein